MATKLGFLLLSPLCVLEDHPRRPKTGGVRSDIISRSGKLHQRQNSAQISVFCNSSRFSTPKARTISFTFCEKGLMQNSLLELSHLLLVEQHSTILWGWILQHCYQSRPDFCNSWKSFFVFLSNPGDLIFGRVLSESSSRSGTGQWRRRRRRSRRTKVGPVLETGTPPRSQVTSISDFFGALANFSFFPRKRIPRKNHIISHKEKRTSPRSLSRPRPRATLDLTPLLVTH